MKINVVNYLSIAIFVSKKRAGTAAKGSVSQITTNKMKKKNLISVLMMRVGELEY